MLAANQEPDESMRSEPLALTGRQQIVYELLENAAAKKDQFGEWYLGALKALRDQGPDCFAHAANSIREIAEKLPARAGIPKPDSPVPEARLAAETVIKLRSSSYASGWEGEIISEELASALKKLEKLQGIFEGPSRTKMLKAALERRDRYSKGISPIHRKQRNREFARVGSFFQSVTHHGHIPTNEEFLDHLALFENLLIFYLSPVTVSQQKEILGLIGEPPTQEAQERLNALLLHNGANLLFVLERLDRPDWIPFLVELQLFENLREGEPTQEGNVIYRADPALSCLARLAPLAPEEVLGILEKLPKSSNPQIPDQIMRCVAGFKDPSLIPQSLTLLKKLLRHPGNHDWIWIEDILRSWLKLSAYDETLQLLGYYIISTINRQTDRFGSGSGSRFEEIDREVVEPLRAAKPIELATVLFNALQCWRKRQNELMSAEPPLFGIESAIDDNPSTYWLEDFANRTSRVHELEETLATRLFQIGSGVFGSGDDARMEEFDNLLRSDPWNLFSRLRWQIYADHPERTCALARADVISQMPSFSRSSGEHGYEMAQMLEAHSLAHRDDFMNPSEVSEFCTTVRYGPIDDDGDSEPEERFRKRFHFRQLHPIRTLLKAEDLSAYEVLTEGQSPRNAPSYKPVSSGGARTIEHKPPQEAANMASMTDAELWAFLNGWKPAQNRHESEHWWIEESVSALGSKFAELVESEPERFQASSEWWKNVSRPAILYKPLELAVTRISKKKGEDQPNGNAPSENDWRNWFGLASSIAELAKVQAQNENGGEGGDSGEARDWNWPSKVVIKFLRAALEPRFPVPDDLMPEIGRLLRSFVKQPDPGLAAKTKPMLGDWQTTAINSVRGTAIEGLLWLALIQKQANQSEAPEEWIFEVIQECLFADDQSPAVFAIMGSRAQLALYLYGDLFKKTPDLLLPTNKPACRKAFVFSHLLYSDHIGGILHTLPIFPEVAIDHLATINDQEKPEEEERGNFGGRLGARLAFYYWNDLYPSMEEADAILDRYFATATPSQRARAIADISRMFADAPPNPDSEALFQRVRDLWDRRFSTIEAQLDRKQLKIEEVHEELSSFLGWLGSDCHPFDWRFDRVLRALRRLVKPPRIGFMIRNLETLSQDSEKLSQCLEVVDAFISTGSEQDRWSYDERYMRPILIRGLGADDPTTQAVAKRIQENLLRQGLFEYLDLDPEADESH